MSAPAYAPVATTADQRVSELRNNGIRLAVKMLTYGRREQALLVLLSSVQTQARISGVRAELLP